MREFALCASSLAAKNSAQRTLDLRRSAARAGGMRSAVSKGMSSQQLRKALLVCGILAAAHYVFMNVYVASRWDTYSSASFTVSELSAIGAPTRELWVALSWGYTILLAAFGWGVWASAPRTRGLRIAGALTTANALMGIFWPPMHSREVLAAGGGTLTDTMHLVFGGVTVALMLAAMGFSASAFGRKFLAFSTLMIVLAPGFGALTAADAPRVQANLPTPLIGVWERISIAIFLAWVVTLAIALLRAEPATSRRAS
jgi:hypothetical protein